MRARFRSTMGCVRRSQLCALSPGSARAVIAAAIVLAVAAAPGGLLRAPSAFAAYPGSNGKVAFQFEGGDGIPKIFSTNLDGSALTQLTTGIDPVWSPDGRKIAFVRATPGTPIELPGGRGTEIYVMNFDGSGVTVQPRQAA